MGAASAVFRDFLDFQKTHLFLKIFGGDSVAVTEEMAHKSVVLMFVDCWICVYGIHIYKTYLQKMVEPIRNPCIITRVHACMLHTIYLRLPRPWPGFGCIPLPINRSCAKSCRSHRVTVLYTLHVLRLTTTMETTTILALAGHVHGMLAASTSIHQESTWSYGWFFVPIQ